MHMHALRSMLNTENIGLVILGSSCSAAAVASGAVSG